MRKQFFAMVALLMMTIAVQAQNSKPASTPLYKNAKAPIEQRIKDLLQRMTLEEKAGQLNQVNGGVFTGPAANDPGQKAKLDLAKKGGVGSFLNVIGVSETRNAQQAVMENSRLGIPLLFGFDVIHGYRTVFPIPLAEAGTWDLAGIEKNASIHAKEAAAAGVHWTFAPMCDISNDPRWGRVMEGGGEDPYLGGLVAAARVRGLQGKQFDAEHIMACIKHFAVYGAVEAGREYNNVDVSRVALWNKYLPPYKAAVEAGAATVMNSFNVFDGIPAGGNKYLVTDILQKKWGFKGFVVSDWGSFGEMINHGYAVDEKDAALKALQAGSHMDMEANVSGRFVPQLVKEGKLTMAQVDDAVGRILYFKFKLGLFEDPYKYSNAEREAATLFNAANRAQALEAAKKSILLLKNNHEVLPLKSEGTKIALIGHFANSKEDMFDFWIANGTANDAVTVKEGLENRFGAHNVNYAPGYLADGTTDEQLVKDAVAAADKASVVVVNIGISGKMAGEDRALANINISEGQLRLLRALQKQGRPVIALVSSGRPLVLTNIQDLTTAIVQTWILGTETGTAVAAMLAGDYNPSAKAVMSFPYALGQVPVYYNHFNTNRPAPETGDASWKSRYRDIPNEPLYPFGYGLSYTTYNYSNLSLSSEKITRSQPLQVRVTVKNSGKVDGEEVVQLYIRDIAASIVRPVKELKAFQKVFLKAGETKEISFVLTGKDLSFYDGEGNARLENGAFKIMVGGDSKNVLEKGFVLQ
jgi:beta-glucosidase